MHCVRPETQGTTVYWFDKDSNTFLAQGENFNEIVLNLRSRYPTHVFFLEVNEQVVMIAEKTEWKPVAVNKTVEI